MYIYICIYNLSLYISKNLNLLSIHVYTHTYIYIYICVCVCVPCRKHICACTMFFCYMQETYYRLNQRWSSTEQKRQNYQQPASSCAGYNFIAALFGAIAAGVRSTFGILHPTKLLPLMGRGG